MVPTRYDRRTPPAGSAPVAADAKREWRAPTLAELPALTKLTLQTGGAGGPIGGGGGPGGFDF